MRKYPLTPAIHDLMDVIEVLRRKSHWGVLVRSSYNMDTPVDKPAHASKIAAYKSSQGGGNSTFRSPSYIMHFLGFPELYAYRW